MSLSRHRIYIGRLTRDHSARDLERKFSKFGRLKEFDMKFDYAFAEYYESRDAEDAIHMMDGEKVEGARIVVEAAKARGFDSNNRSKIGPRGCFNCGSQGHWARDCGSRRSNNSFRSQPMRSRYPPRRERSRSRRRSYSRGRDDRSRRSRSGDRKRDRSRERSPPPRSRSRERTQKRSRERTQKRSRERTPERSRERTPKRSQSPKRSRERSPAARSRERSRERSPAARSQTPKRSRERSPAARSRERSPVARSRSRSPLKENEAPRSPAISKDVDDAEDSRMDKNDTPNDHDTPKDLDN